MRPFTGTVFGIQQVFHKCSSQHSLNTYCVPGTSLVPYCKCPLSWRIGLGTLSGSLSSLSPLSSQLWAPGRPIAVGCWLHGASSALVCVGFRALQGKTGRADGDKLMDRQTDEGNSCDVWPLSSARHPACERGQNASSADCFGDYDT